MKQNVYLDKKYSLSTLYFIDNKQQNVRIFAE